MKLSIGNGIAVVSEFGHVLGVFSDLNEAIEDFNERCRPFAEIEDYDAVEGNDWSAYEDECSTDGDPFEG